LVDAVRPCRRAPEQRGTARETTTVARTALPWTALAGFVRKTTCVARSVENGPGEAGAANMTIAAAAMRGAQKAFIRHVDFYPDSANANRAASFVLAH
jgi:hypothetical protein